MNIRFYILESSFIKSLHFVCKLIEKEVGTQRIYVHTASEAETERLDALLWTFRDDSFVPHQRYATDAQAPVLMGHGEIPPKPVDLLLNLTHALPASYHSFKELIEVVWADLTTQQLARERYKHYRNEGHSINTYKLKANEL